MKTTALSTVQSTQRDAQRLLGGLAPAHLRSDLPFAYVVNRTSEDNPMRGAPSRIAFLADSPAFVRRVIAAMRTLGYETGFAVFVMPNRAFEVIDRMPEQSVIAAR